MNLKPTIFLLLFLAVGAGGWFGIHYFQPNASTHAKPWKLQDTINSKELTRIEVARGQEPRFVLEKLGTEWSLPGKWPVRATEVKLWLEQLEELYTRFDAIPFQNESELALNSPALIVKLTEKNRTVTLKFAEKAKDESRFDRPTYLRIDDKSEVLRLGPGVLAALDRNQAYFQQRRLFPMERIAREEGAKDKVDTLVAEAVEIKGPAGRFRLTKKGDSWQLQDPVVDQIEPSKLQALLTGVPDLWVEKFVEKKGLTEFGLLQPEYEVSVTRPSGAEVKLLLGKVSDSKTKFVTKQPPPQSPFMPPQKPQVEKVVEEYRYAKLADNDQIFEVKTDPLPKIALAVDALRDPRLARFKSENVQRIEISEPALVLVKQDKKWKLEQPRDTEAEDSAVNELIEKLAGLEAKEKDIVDVKDSAQLGTKTTTIKLQIDENKKPRILVYEIGNQEADKVPVRVEGNARLSRVDAAILKTVHRSPLAYRAKLVIDVSDLHRLEVNRPGEKFVLVEEKGNWKLAEPIQAPIEAKLGRELAEAVGHVEAVEFIADQPSEADLDKLYGLAKPAHTVRLVRQDEQKPAQTLSIGSQRAGKEEYFARVDQGPIFTVKKTIFEKLERGSLAYRTPQIWTIAQDQINEITVKNSTGNYRLVRKGPQWNLVEPFEAPASNNEVEDLLFALTPLKTERFVAHQAKDPTFGLEAPGLSVTIKFGDKETKELQIGAPVKETPEARYARTSDESAVFVVDPKTLVPLKGGALDLLERRVLTLDPSSLQKIRVTGPTSYTLARQGKDWKVTDTDAPAFKPDESVLKSSLHALGILEAAKIVAFGKKIDWKEYELDKPALSLNLSAEKEKDHVIELGKALPNGQRYARIDQQEAVALLDARVAEILGRSYLDFVDAAILSYDLDSIVKIQRQMKDADVEFQKQGDGWKMIKPSDRPADTSAVSNLLDKTFRLRAKRVAAYPAKNLEKFGLEQPTAILTLTPKGDQKPHVLKIGQTASETGDRFAQLQGSELVVVLEADLAQPLVAPPLFFADRQLTGLVAPDRAIFERAGRKAVFARADGPWKLIEPIKANAEDNDLEELVQGLQRLRADEIIADSLEADTNAKEHGLDKPAAQWHFKSGDQEILHLILGGTESTKSTPPRRYAQLGAKGPVFLLNGKLSAKLLEEYRERKPWPALDAAQALQLSVREGEGKTFILEKRDQGWGVVGEPKADVNLAIVTDTLDALAGLKVLRYVADVKGDLQLHGLKPAAWTIEVRTPTGAKKLLLGRYEGDSRRLYAALPDSDAIFVLDEVASTRLARPLSVYLKEKSEGK